MARAKCTNINNIFTNDLHSLAFFVIFECPLCIQLPKSCQNLYLRNGDHYDNVLDHFFVKCMDWLFFALISAKKVELSGVRVVEGKIILKMI